MHELEAEEGEGDMKNEGLKKAFVKGVSSLLCLALAACTFAGCAKSSALQLGVGPEPQDQILGWIVAELCETKGVDVEVVEVTNGILNMQPALDSGSLDMGIEFSQNAWRYVLKKPDMYEPGDLRQLQEEYASRGLDWYGLPLVVDHYTLAVSRGVVSHYNLLTMSGLARVSGELTLGADSSFFEREDGYPWLQNEYGFDFAKVVNLPVDGLFNAINTGEVDVIPVHSLDGALEKSSAVVLEDDQGMYPDSTAGVVVNMKVSEKYPQIEESVYELSSVLYGKRLRELARQVYQNLMTPQEAAKLFLEEKEFVTEND